MDFPTKDEGKLAIAIYVKENDLIIDFGKEISWIGLHKEEVEQLIKILEQRKEKLP